MVIVVIPSTQVPPTTVILGSPWWVVTATGHALEMVAALLAYLMEWHLVVNVSYSMHSIIIWVINS